MVDGLFLCATFTGRRRGHTPFVQAGAETSDTSAEAVKTDPRCSWLGPRAYARGGVGVKPTLEFAMLQERHYLCKGVCACFRTFFACLMST